MFLVYNKINLFKNIFNFNQTSNSSVIIIRFLNVDFNNTFSNNTYSYNRGYNIINFPFYKLDSYIFNILTSQLKEYLRFVGLNNCDIIIEVYSKIFFYYEGENNNFLESILLFKYVAFFLDPSNKNEVCFTLLTIFNLEIHNLINLNVNYDLFKDLRDHLFNYHGITLFNISYNTLDLDLVEVELGSHLLISSLNTNDGVYKFLGEGVNSRIEFSLFCKGIFKDCSNSSDSDLNFIRLYSVESNRVVFFKPCSLSRFRIILNLFYYKELCGISYTPYNFIHSNIYQGFVIHHTIESSSEYVKAISLKDPRYIDHEDISSFFTSNSNFNNKQLNSRFFGNLCFNDKIFPSAILKPCDSNFMDQRYKDINNFFLISINLEKEIKEAPFENQDESEYIDNRVKSQDMGERGIRADPSDSSVYSNYDCSIKFFDNNFFNGKELPIVEIPYFVRYVFKDGFTTDLTFLSKLGITNPIKEGAEDIFFLMSDDYYNLILSEVEEDFLSYNMLNTIGLDSIFEIPDLNFEILFYFIDVYKIFKCNSIFNIVIKGARDNKGVNLISPFLRDFENWGLNLNHNIYNKSNISSLYRDIYFKLFYLFLLINVKLNPNLISFLGVIPEEFFKKVKLEFLVTYGHLNILDKFIREEFNINLGIYVSTKKNNNSLMLNLINLNLENCLSNPSFIKGEELNTYTNYFFKELRLDFFDSKIEGCCHYFKKINESIEILDSKEFSPMDDDVLFLKEYMDSLNLKDSFLDSLRDAYKPFIKDGGDEVRSRALAFNVSEEKLLIKYFKQLLNNSNFCFYYFTSNELYFNIKISYLNNSFINSIKFFKNNFDNSDYLRGSSISRVSNTDTGFNYPFSDDSGSLISEKLITDLTKKGGFGVPGYSLPSSRIHSSIKWTEDCLTEFKTKNSISNNPFLSNDSLDNLEVGTEDLIISKGSLSSGIITYIYGIEQHSKIIETHLKIIKTFKSSSGLYYKENSSISILTHKDKDKINFLLTFNKKVSGLRKITI